MRVSPLAELFLRLGETRGDSFSREQVRDMIRDLIDYEEECFNDAKSGSYRKMFSRRV